MYGAILGAIGTEVSAKGQLYGSMSKANMMRSQGRAQLSEATTRQAELEDSAQIAEQSANIRADQIRRYGERIQAKGTAIAGASGIDVGTGSVVLANMDSAVNIETDAQRALWSGENRAKLLRYQGASGIAVAQYNRRVAYEEADVTETMAIIQFGASLLSSASQALGGSGSQVSNVQPYGVSANGPYQGTYGFSQPAPSTQLFGSSDVGPTGTLFLNSPYSTAGTNLLRGD